MFRPQTNYSNKSSVGASPNKSSTPANNNGDSSQSTIREIRSRAIGSTTNNNARQLLANRRQAMSMERLNSSSTTTTATSMHSSSSSTGINDKEKCSPTSGSSNSINGSTASSPSRSSSGGGLNRTASRVSRFRSAKAVFERLSSANSNQNIKPDRPATLEKPKGTVASRYAAAAAARAAAAAAAQQQQSPRTRISNRSTSDTHNSRFSSNSHSAKHDTNQPKPQPRVTPTSRRSITTSSASTSLTNTETNTKSKTTTPIASIGSSNATKSQTQSKPPPRDLIDKIVLEIAAENQQDANCTIQDLSDCNVSGIPETLDFDRCFQDVEMMTEEEARQLLSRKSEQFSTTNSKCSTEQKTPLEDKPQTRIEIKTKTEQVCVQPDRPDIFFKSKQQLDEVISYQVSPSSVEIITAIPVENSTLANTSLNPSSSPLSSKTKVRFSDELVQVYDTHAVEDYDRRNNDIDPATASIEYEIEKSKERAGIRDEDDDDDDDDDEEEEDVDDDDEKKKEANLDINGAVTTAERFNQNARTSSPLSQAKEIVNNPSSSRESHHSARGDSHDFCDNSNTQHALDKRLDGDKGELAPLYDKEYVESLQRELSLKRILEQNLRDLQSQYYESVRELDDYKSTAETKISDLERELKNANNKCEMAQNELTDTREQCGQFEKQLNDMKESSQLLEKKYHRAKKIIKDMQLREESFTRREQLYQQKLDEIEFELGVLINSIDKTIYDDGLRFFNLTDGSSCQRQHQTRLDVFGLIKQMLNNFNANQSTQNAQIKQRVVTILEQQLASLMATTNGATCVSGTINPVPPVAASTAAAAATTTTTTTIPRNTLGDNSNNLQISSNNNNINHQDISNKHSQSYQFASHRLSQPNLPHPIGVGGQPTKLFHGLAPMPITLNEPSPPQSVNSYPSSNSLNSLNNTTSGQNNNNNNINNNNNNNVIIGAKSQPQQPETQSTTGSNILTTTISALKEDNFQPVADIQVPYQTNEWHDKPVSEWTTNQVSTWLLALGLDQYISKFEDRNVNGQSLINLDSTVLKGLGVLNSNDRNLLKKKIRELRVEMEKERKLVEKKMKENLKDKSKGIQLQSNQQSNNKPSWKKGLLS